MPNLPRPRLRRSPRTSAPDVVAPSEPNVEIVEQDGVRWINIENPGPLDRAWLEEHFVFHHLAYEDVASRNQRPKIDDFGDYLFIVLHFQAFDKKVGRLSGGELDVFIGRDFLSRRRNEALQ